MELTSTALVCPQCGAVQAAGGALTGGGFSGGADTTERSFANAVRICFRKYDGFSGRATRAEYWWFVLLQVIIQLGFSALAAVTHSGVINVISALVSLGLLLPGLAVAFRRLHDIDRSAWWLLLAFVPLVGGVILLLWDCTRGTRGPNRFGAEVGPT